MQVPSSTSSLLLCFLMSLLSQVFSFPCPAQLNFFHLPQVPDPTPQFAIMADPPPLSLYDLIREHLRYDSDSGPSTPRHPMQLMYADLPDEIYYPLPEARLSPNSSGTTTSNDGPVAGNSTASVNRGPFCVVPQTAEPFPTFNEEESATHAAMEESFQAAFTAAARTKTRSIIEPAIQAPAALNFAKGETLEGMKDLLSNQQLSESARKRFMALTNMILSRDRVLFHSDRIASMELVAVEITEVILVPRGNGSPNPRPGQSHGSGQCKSRHYCPGDREGQGHRSRELGRGVS
jgi:hypothetical protein